jgi:hypothetical protein
VLGRAWAKGTACVSDKHNPKAFSGKVMIVGDDIAAVMRISLCGASAAAPPHMQKEQGQPARFLLF